MKLKVLIGGCLIVVLNALVFVPDLSAHARYFVAGSLALGAWLALKAITEKAPLAEPSPEPAPVAPAPVPPKSSAEAETLAVLGSLQNKGRFIDFVMDDISKYSDAQVGAAARVVHQGCKAALSELVSIEPIANESEGSRVSVPQGAQDWYRLSGSVGGDGPFSGVLVHKGWKATRVNLPRVTKLQNGELPAIAPAQVEVK